MSIKKPLIENGECKGILIFSFDITKEKQAELAKQLFIESMGHDLRTPFSGCLGAAEVLLNDPTLSGKERKKFLNFIMTSGKAVLDMFNQVLDLINVDQPQAIKIFSTKELCQKIDDLFMAIIHQKKLTFINQTAKNYLIKANQFAIETILINLIGNAVKFTKKGSITLFCDIIDDQLVMKITDTGIGIDQKHHDMIFDKFTKVKPSYEAAEFVGTGRGLYLVKHYTQQLGGTISLDSKIGKGSTFTCHIPIEKVLNQAQETKENSSSDDIINAKLRKQQELSTNKNNKTKIAKTKTYKKSYPHVKATRSDTTPENTILIVEDDDIAATVSQQILNELGYHCDIATDGQQAVELAQKFHYPLIFMDIGLPKLKGDQATELIRQQSLNKNTPIIALTAHATPENKQHYLKVGINKVLNKPLTLEKAQTILNDYLAKKDEEQALKQAAIIDHDYIKKSFGWDHETIVKFLKAFLKQYSQKTLDRMISMTDWLEIQETVIQLKANSSYIGASRLGIACMNLYNAITEQQTALYAKLYQKVFAEIDNLKNEIHSHYLV